MFLLKFKKAKKKEENTTEHPPKLIAEQRSLSQPNMTRDKKVAKEEVSAKIKPPIQNRRRGFTLFSLKKPDESNGQEFPRRAHDFRFLSQSTIPPHILIAEEIDEFITAVKGSCTEICNTKGSYFQTLSDNQMQVLSTIAENCKFVENIVFLNRFNAYRQGLTTGQELYPFLSELNVDDNDDHKELQERSRNGLLNTDDAKELYAKIADYIARFLISNLLIKRNDISQALQQVNKIKIGYS